MVVRREAKQYFLCKAIVGCDSWGFAYFFKNKHIITIKSNNTLSITKASTYEQTITYKVKKSLICYNLNCYGLTGIREPWHEFPSGLPTL